MKTIRAVWTHLLLSILLATSIAFGIVNNAYAQGGIPPRDRIPAGQTIEGDMLLFGQTVTVDGNVTGDLFVIGNNITVNGEIGGSLYAIGESIAVNGAIGGSAYQGGLELQFGPGSYVGRNAYLVGVELATDQSASVGNDLYAAGLQAWFSGEVGRYLRSAVIILNVEGKVGHGLDEPEEGAEGGDGDSDSAHMGGVLALIRLEKPIKEYAPLMRSTSLLSRIQINKPARAEAQTNPVAEWTLDYFRKLITLLVFGALAIWLFPVKLKSWATQVRGAPLSSGLWGLVVLIFAGIVALVTAAIIPAAVVLFWKLTLWGLASAFLAFGSTSLALAGITFIMAAVYISKVIVAYLLGDMILGRLAPGIASRPFWPLLLGAVIFMALRLIPAVGWVFGLLAALVGLGAIWLVYRSPELQLQEPASEALAPALADSESVESLEQGQNKEEIEAEGEDY